MGHTTVAVLATLFVVAAVPFAPTEAVLIGASGLAATGALPLPAVIVVGALGCATSDVVNYCLGRFTGASMLAKARRKKPTVVDWVSQQLQNRPMMILVVARFLPLGGIVAAMACGATRFSARRFLPISLLGSLIWTAYAAMLGYLGTELVGEPIVGIAIGFAVATALGGVSGFIGNRLPRRAEPALAVEAG